jgi:hypothetical protein
MLEQYVVIDGKQVSLVELVDLYSSKMPQVSEAFQALSEVTAKAQEVLQQFAEIVGEVSEPDDEQQTEETESEETEPESDDAEDTESEESEEPETANLTESATFEEGDFTVVEKATGNVVALSEGMTEYSGGPLTLDIVVVEPGWGNTRDNNHYSSEVLKRDSHIFKGLKMYATDHVSSEKSVLTEVSEVLDCPVGFTETGAPIARVGIFNEDFARSTFNRFKLGTLNNLETSIVAEGRRRKGFSKDGRTGYSVEALTKGISIDWVTRAGAGGRAYRMAESEDGTSESETEDTVLEREEVIQHLREAKLSGPAIELLTKIDYPSMEELDDVINSFKQALKESTGSGKPFGNSQKPSSEKTVSVEEIEKRKDEINKKWLGIS